MEPGYMQGDSSNLPTEDLSAVLNFLSTNPTFISAEARNVKTLRNTREGYGDEAVGKVQVRREDGTPFCSVKARVTPEHRVHVRGYLVEVIVDEENEEIVDCKCYDCVASQGGCKHAVALLFWLHRRAEEPSVTSVICYWQTSKLSKVGSEAAVPFRTMLKVQVPDLAPRDDDFLKKYLENGKKSSSKSLLCQFQCDNAIKRVSLHCLAMRYKNQLVGAKDVEDFKHFCMQQINHETCAEVEELTRKQYKCSSWYDARYGRITASKAYEVSRCKSKEGSLLQRIFGAVKVTTTDAMERGLTLEDEVLQVIKEKRKITIKKCGFIIVPSFPFLGASPDGISNEFCIEIKCPSKQSTVGNYITKDKVIAIKHFTQLQLQMFLTNKKKGMFCVAAPDFEISKNVEIVDVDLDESYCLDIIKSCYEYFSCNIFNKLLH